VTKFKRVQCIQCGAPTEGKVLCDQHRQEQSRKRKERWDELKASGMCTECGRNPIGEQFSSLCDGCGEWHRQYNAARRNQSQPT
jgi:hypothetical protein